MSLTEDLVVLSTVVNTINNCLAHSAGLLQFLEINFNLLTSEVNIVSVCLVILLTKKLPHQYEVLASEKTVTLSTLNIVRYHVIMALCQT